MKSTAPLLDRRVRRLRLLVVISLVAAIATVGLVCGWRASRAVEVSTPRIADARLAERRAEHTVRAPRIEARDAQDADHDEEGARREDRLTFLLTSCEPDPRVLSLPERRLLPEPSKDVILDVLERSRSRARTAVTERYTAIFGRPPAERATIAEIMNDVWAVLSPVDRGRAAEAAGGHAAGSPSLRGVDALVATLAAEPARAYDELRQALGAGPAELLWGGEIISWCAFTVPL